MGGEPGLCFGTAEEAVEKNGLVSIKMESGKGRAQRHMQRATQLMNDQSFGARRQVPDESFGVKLSDRIKRMTGNPPGENKPRKKSAQEEEPLEDEPSCMGEGQGQQS